MAFLWQSFGIRQSEVFSIKNDCEKLKKSAYYVKINWIAWNPDLHGKYSTELLLKPTFRLKSTPVSSDNLEKHFLSINAFWNLVRFLLAKSLRRNQILQLF